MLTAALTKADSDMTPSLTVERVLDLELSVCLQTQRRNLCCCRSTALSGEIFFSAELCVLFLIILR